MTQAAVARLTGLRQAYICRIEKGRGTPSIENLRKFAHALEVPLYQLFCEGGEPPDLRTLPKTIRNEKSWGSEGKDAQQLTEFRRCLSKMTSRDQKILLLFAQKMAKT